MRSGTRRAWNARLAVAALAAALVASVVPARSASAAVNTAALKTAALKSAEVKAVAKKTVAKCDATGWASVSGRPVALGPLAPAGIYVWNEKGVWRVAVTHADRRVQVFQGTVSFDVAMTATPVGVEGRFDVVVPNKNAASFTFKNYGGIDSIAITAPCATTMSVTGTIDGTPVDVSQIFLGPTGANPTAVPATITRSAVATATAAAVVVVSPTVAPASAAATTCTTTAWPAVTIGKPSIRPRTASGLYAWSEKSGWSVLVSGDPGRPQVFKGKVTVIAPVSSGGVVVQPLSNEGASDDVTVQGNTVLFEFKAGNGIDGFVLFAPCASQVTIEGTIDGVPMTAAQMFVGAGATPVTGVPFTATR